ncbi:hypothetical protein NDU88_006359 [Pleurodeles waltl]|uniref:Uncharacterized protein n=1 Tax=Pleurodeles waltl TaxID=8319 RepID=A0AAV7X1B3_PLEWA|nr:hypothetical protein NDU88_006359 [Pleurodeles waltl]
MYVNIRSFLYFSRVSAEGRHFLHHDADPGADLPHIHRCVSGDSRGPGRRDCVQHPHHHLLHLNDNILWSASQPDIYFALADVAEVLQPPSIWTQCYETSTDIHIAQSEGCPPGLFCYPAVILTTVSWSLVP